MKKFVKTIFLLLAFTFTSATISSTSDSFDYEYALRKETPESLHVLKSFGVNLKERELIDKYPAICPIPTKDNLRISSLYGERMHPIYHAKYIHRGIDYAAPRGTKVVVTGDGIVTGVKYVGSYGKQVTVSHIDNYRTRYAHLSKILVNTGDTICKGDTIGEIGSTGLSTGNHLHYEIIHNNQNIDPMSILPDTLQGDAYLDYLQSLNDHYYLSCSDFLFNI